MTRFLLVCLGGALGSGARYPVPIAAAAAIGIAFPYGTLLVNAAGSFAVAFVMHAGMTGEVLTPEWRLLLTTGVMGGFTTYSTFNYETLNYFREGAWGGGDAQRRGDAVRVSRGRPGRIRGGAADLREVTMRALEGEQVMV